MRKELRDSERQLVVLQSELKEKNVMQRLKYAETLQTVAELKQQLAQLESKVRIKIKNLHYFSRKRKKQHVPKSEALQFMTWTMLRLI